MSLRAPERLQDLFPWSVCKQSSGTTAHIRHWIGGERFDDCIHGLVRPRAPDDLHGREANVPVHGV
jgi:hypothetical protein